MSHHPGLSGAWDKLWWANQHLKVLKVEFDRVCDPKRNPIPIEFEPEGQDAMLYRVRGLPDFNRAALILGDTIQNLRSSLDHMTWFLVMNGSDPNPKRPDLVQFPMAKSASAFDERVKDRLPGVPPEQRALIKRHQPYRRGDNRCLILRRLQNLSNRDKHRLLVPSVMTPAQLTLEFSPIRGCQIVGVESLFNPRRALKVGTKIARVYLRPDPPESTQGEVKMEGNLLAYPSFGYGRNVVNHIDFAGKVISDLFIEMEGLL